MHKAAAILALITAGALVSCGSNQIIQQRQAHLTSQVSQNATGSPYDGGVRIDGTTQLEVRNNNFLYNVAFQDSSATHLPLVMRKHSRMKKVVKNALIGNGLFYTGDYNQSTGLLAPKSQAPYGLQVQAVGYFNEVLLQNPNLGTRILHTIASRRPENFSDKILRRGSYRVKASYRFELKDRRDGRVIDNRQITVSTTVLVRRDHNGSIDEDRKVSDEDMLAEAIERFLRALPGRTAIQPN